MPFRWRQTRTGTLFVCRHFAKTANKSQPAPTIRFFRRNFSDKMFAHIRRKNTISFWTVSGIVRKSFPATKDYDVRYSSNFCRPYWGEALKDIVPVRSCDMRYSSPDEWTFQLLPSNIIYKSYMACGREPRLGIHFVDSMQPDDMSYWDCSIGARVSLLRYGSQDPLYPEGIELEMDACAFPRLGLNRARDLFSCDYRFAFPLAFRIGRCSCSDTTISVRTWATSTW